MSALHGMKCDKGLVLILHTPGGEFGAVETIVDYLHKKFDEIITIVPYFAMSGGSMISLASDCIIMGKQSQIGPIDPQIIFQDRYNSARAIVNAFSKARNDIKDDPNTSKLWDPILFSMGPSLITETENYLKHSEQLVSKWFEGECLGMNLKQKKKQ